MAHQRPQLPTPRPGPRFTPAVATEPMIKGEYFASCPKGFEDVLCAELIALGASDVKQGFSGAWFSGGNAALYKACLGLRSASRVLKPLREFAARHPMMVYDQIKRMKWEHWITPESTIKIDCVSFNSTNVDHTHYMELRAKDAICDRFRENCNGLRPSVDRERPDLLIHLFINNNRCLLSIDAAGVALHRRGYRTQAGEAPLRENLAAALLLRSGYDGTKPLYDPFCGSGTFLIEAAMIATNRAPNIEGRGFSFQLWPEYDEALFQQVRQELQAREHAAPESIVGSDVDAAMAAMAKRNAVRAGVAPSVRVETADFRDEEAWSEMGHGITTGTVVTNPPYGERLLEGEAEELYKLFGDVLKKRFTGWDAWILSGSDEGLKKVGLRHSKRMPTTNGGIPCRFVKYELYVGSKKTS